MSELIKKTLNTPISRGDSSINVIELRKPKSGELRGLSMFDLLRMDVDALVIVLPRITSPVLTQHDVRNMDPADLFKLAKEVTNFLSSMQDQDGDYQTA